MSGGGVTDIEDLNRRLAELTAPLWFTATVHDIPPDEKDIPSSETEILFQAITWRGNERLEHNAAYPITDIVCSKGARPARVQFWPAAGTAWTLGPSLPHHSRVRVLTHINKLDDCFGQFLMRVICDCGACREIEPEALARLVGWRVTLKEFALRMRRSRCGKKAAEVVAVARPRPRGVPEESALITHNALLHTPGGSA